MAVKKGMRELARRPLARVEARGPCKQSTVLGAGHGGAGGRTQLRQGLSREMTCGKSFSYNTA